MSTEGRPGEVAKPHVEVFAGDFVFGTQWGFQCFTCGFEQTGVTDFATAEEHADMHRCADKAGYRNINNDTEET